MARSLAGKQGDCSLASGVLHARREVGVPLPNSLLSLSLCRLDEVQLIVEVPVSAEQYVAQGFQRSISPPDACPHCRAANALDILEPERHRQTVGRFAALDPTLPLPDLPQNGEHPPGFRPAVPARSQPYG